MRKEKGRGLPGILALLLFLFLPVLEAAAFETEEAVEQQYQSYQDCFEAVGRIEELEENGYQILKAQVFPVTFESFGEEELTFVPAMEKTWNRLAFFLADSGGKIVYRCNDLETNYCFRGTMRQPTKELASISFVDADKDGKKDILLLTRCENDAGTDKTEKTVYKVGDVLFQGEKTFYRDWRISDKINRFGMNKSADCILSCVRDGQSCEFLYTAKTLDELLVQGFSIIEEQCYTRNFEKLGRLAVVPGTARISQYNIFMVYLVNEKGDIVWSLQPMDEYDSLYALKGIHGRDLDGDGMKDLAVLGKYISEGPDKEVRTEVHCAVYYQRNGGFERDTEFERNCRCTEEDTMEGMVQKIREYWGWQAEQ